MDYDRYIARHVRGLHAVRVLACLDVAGHFTCVGTTAGETLRVGRA